jgi:Cyclin, N-terminal domain
MFPFEVLSSSAVPLHFAATTQHQRWTFSKAALAYRRRISLEETEKRVAAAIEAEEGSAAATAGPPAKRLKKDGDNGTAPDGSPLESQLLIPATAANIDAHLRLVHLASRKVLQLCRETKFDRAIMATAVTYLRRFFVNCTALEHDPENIMTAAIFLAIKVEACPYTEVPDFLQRLGAASEF